MATRVRRDVWKLDEWDDTILWYARAVGEMQKRAIADPTSWRYQAAIHEYTREEDPLQTPDDQLPSDADQDRFWTQCQHTSWYFLPWHRIYLFYFEQIVTATIVGLGGPSDWALPYWNYSGPASTNVRKLPAAFRDEQLPDGTPNPLFVEQRWPETNAGEDIATDRAVSLTRSLTDALFVGQGTGSNPGFGGPRTKFNHIGGDQPMGYLEQVPHGSMHVAVGPWMGNSFTTAALDPIFWLHHGNIDRLWSVWLGRNPTTHLNPPDDQWKTPPAPGFEFHDANGNVVSLTPQQVVDSTASPLNYQYEDQSDPLAGTPDARVPRRAPVLGLQAEPMSEMVGATERPFALAGQSTTAQVRVSRPSGPALLGMQSPDELPDRVYLNIENITGVHPKTSYAVYVNLPSGADPEQHQELFAGLLPMFGVTEASRTQGDHSGSGLHYSLDITDVVRGLRARNAWDPNTMRVTFVPEHPARAPQAQPQGGLGIAAPEPEGVQVGRVSLYYGSSET